MSHEHLSTLLWRERELLDLLLFKAEEKQYLLVNGKSRWLGRVSREIEIVLSQLRVLEVERAAATEDLAAGLGLAEDPSLRQVAQASPVPWNDLLNQHYEALLIQVAEIRGLSDANRSLIEGGLSAIDSALRSVRPESVTTYTAAGRQAGSSSRAFTLDGTL